MLYAIISDVHANLEALKAVIEEASRLNAGRIICLGDLIGYNANPNECVRLLREKDATSVAGNHDTRGAGIKEAHNFNPAAKAAILWTRERLSLDSRNYIASLSISANVGRNAIAFHGTLNDTDSYILDATDAKTEFSLLSQQKANAAVFFFGHTHIPAVYEYCDGMVFNLNFSGELKLKKTARYLINPGSVGQPRDRNANASFAMYDDDMMTISFHRIKYDMDAARDKIIKAGLPAFLAERLLTGS